MKTLPFVQVYDVSFARLQEAIDFQLRTVQEENLKPPGAKRQLGEAVHWISGAVHQWHSTMVFLCDAATETGIERSAMAAKLEVDWRRLELDVAARLERLHRGDR